MPRFERPRRPGRVRRAGPATGRSTRRCPGRSWRCRAGQALPSVDEAFGLVLVESLAAGTPVVAARSGACPEIVTDDLIGRLFEPDAADDPERWTDMGIIAGAGLVAGLPAGQSPTSSAGGEQLASTGASG